jgi:hypothetical protein
VIGTTGQLILASETPTDVEAILGGFDVRVAASRTALKALNTATISVAYFDGSFWERVNTVAWSTYITADTQEGMFAISTSNAAFAWRRRHDNMVMSRWFQTVGDGVTDDLVPLTAWLNMATL